MTSHCLNSTTTPTDTAEFAKAKAKAKAQAALESKGKGKKASAEFALTRQHELEKYEERLQLHGVRMVCT